jgi:hypothetical protein
MLNILLIVGFNIFAFFILYIILNRNIEKKYNPDSVLDTIREEVNRLIIELNQTADRNINLIEEKIDVLNDAIAKADKRLNLFQKESEKHDMSARVYNNILKKGPLPESEKSAAEVKPKLSTKEQVIDLYQKGFSAEIIANNVGATISEVELIISLKGE